MSQDAKLGVGTGQAPNQNLVPRCHFCGADPAPVLPAFTKFGSGQVTVWFCGNPNCRAVHSVQLVSIDQQQQQQSLLIRP